MPLSILAWLKVDSLAILIGKSAPTAPRALALLECFRIIEHAVYLHQKAGGNGANTLCIVPACIVADRAEMIARKQDLYQRSVIRNKQPLKLKLYLLNALKNYYIIRIASRLSHF